MKSEADQSLIWMAAGLTLEAEELQAAQLRGEHLVGATNEHHEHEGDHDNAPLTGP